MRKFRKLPVTIEAVQFTGDNFDEIKEFCPTAHLRKSGEIIIPTLEDGKDKIAKHVAKPTDFVIKGVQGEFYPCDEIIFWKTYEEVHEVFDSAL